MALIVDRYVGDNGEVLIPIGSGDNNTKNLISERGTFYKVFTHDDTVPTIVEGNPMGLLLAITYPATP